MTAYYNEIEPSAAAWLRELIKAGLIAPGVVDERSILDVKPEDVREFTQCHWFAGVGVWSYALRRAGWPDDRRIWTGSCPCQPFSAAGKGGGFADERHLWPAFDWLIGQCKPDVVLGEQVASKDGLNWFDLVLTDLEGQAYATGAVDTCSAGHGAPHIRQRLRFAAQRLGLADRAGSLAGREGAAPAGHGHSALAGSGLRGLADTGRAGHERLRGPGEASGSPGSDGGEAQQRERGGLADRAGSASGGVADARSAGLEGRNARIARPELPTPERGGTSQSGGVADDASGGRGEERSDGRGVAAGDRTEGLPAGLVYGRDDGGVADTECDGREVALFDGRSFGSADSERTPDQSGMRGASAFGMAAADGGDAGAERQQRGGEQRFQPQDGSDGRLVNDRRREFQLARPGPTNGFWGDADWLRCRDAKWRPVRPSAQQMVDGSALSLGRLCDSSIGEVEASVEAWAKRHQRDGTEAVRNLWDVLSQEEVAERTDGGFDSVREAPFLLAFLRQLSDQGWQFPIGNERASSEASRIPLRVLRYDEHARYSSRGRGLDEQQSDELADPLRLLSQILAHHTEASWGLTGWKNVGSFPLVRGAPARMVRLRGYGNAVDAHATKAFVEAFVEAQEDLQRLRLTPRNVFE